MSDGMILDRSGLDDLLDKYIVLVLNIARLAPDVPDIEVMNITKIETCLKANGINAEALYTIRNAILVNYKSLFEYKSSLE